MQAPNIQTAIPKQRYQLGPYQAVLLGEIESPDPVRYRFILALVREGETQPSVFITCEKNSRAQAQQGSQGFLIPVGEVGLLGMVEECQQSFQKRYCLME